MNVAGHYDVEWWKDGGRRGEINAVTCSHCSFFVKVWDYRRGRDRSGLPRYNRARAVMVKHLHSEHRAALAGAEVSHE